MSTVHIGNTAPREARGKQQVVSSIPSTQNLSECPERRKSTSRRFSARKHASSRPVHFQSTGLQGFVLDI